MRALTAGPKGASSHRLHRRRARPLGGRVAGSAAQPGRLAVGRQRPGDRPRRRGGLTARPQAVRWRRSPSTGRGATTASGRCRGHRGSPPWRGSSGDGVVSVVRRVAWWRPRPTWCCRRGAPRATARGGPLCRALQRGAVRTASGAWGGPPLVRLGSATAGMPSCWAGARFEGPLRQAVTAYKDEDRRDLRGRAGGGCWRRRWRRRCRRPGAAPAARALGEARARRARADRAGVPSSARRRPGRATVVRRAARGRRRVARPGGRAADGLVVVPALVHTRGWPTRRTSTGWPGRTTSPGRWRCVRPWRAVVRGAACVLVDDVVTTGATLAEAARALRDAGARHVVAATVAATPRRRTDPALVAHRTSD